MSLTILTKPSEHNGKIGILYTGGTIGMIETPDGKTDKNEIKKELENISELRDPCMPEWEIIEGYKSVGDSSYMEPGEWVKISEIICNNISKYKGFVILHGTDTMAYTASALSFMLNGIQRSVIITGSQIPLGKIRNDARENIITSLIIADKYNIPVCIYFGNKLLLGCRTVKINASGFDAFLSPNYPELAVVGADIIENKQLKEICFKFKSSDSLTEFRKRYSKNAAIGALRLFPGISPELIRNIINTPINGLILESYGVGNGPVHDSRFINVLKEASEKKIAVVVCTQCLKGMVNLDEYESGKKMKKAGVISGYDMTAEAALTKLYYLFSLGYSYEEVKIKMQESLCDEMTVRQ